MFTGEGIGGVNLVVAEQAEFSGISAAEEKSNLIVAIIARQSLLYFSWIVGRSHSYAIWKVKERGFPLWEGF